MCCCKGLGFLFGWLLFLFVWVFLLLGLGLFGCLGLFFLLVAFWICLGVFGLFVGYLVGGFMLVCLCGLFFAGLIFRVIEKYVLMFTYIAKYLSMTRRPMPAKFQIPHP